MIIFSQKERRKESIAHHTRTHKLMRIKTSSNKKSNKNESQSFITLTARQQPPHPCSKVCHHCVVGRRSCGGNTAPFHRSPPCPYLIAHPFAAPDKPHSTRLSAPPASFHGGAGSGSPHGGRGGQRLRAAKGGGQGAGARGTSLRRGQGARARRSPGNADTVYQDSSSEYTTARLGL